MPAIKLPDGEPADGALFTVATGPTYEHREALKDLGFSWSGRVVKAWVGRAVDDRHPLVAELRTQGVRFHRVVGLRTTGRETLVHEENAEGGVDWVPGEEA